MPGDRLSPSEGEMPGEHPGTRESIQALPAPLAAIPAAPGKRLHPQYGGRALRRRRSAPGAAGTARGLRGAQGGIAAEPAGKGLVLGWEIKGTKEFGEITLFSPSFCFSFGPEF